MYESSRKEYWSPAARHIPVAYAKALLPALVLGYLIPTIAVYIPFSDPNMYLTQGLVALWQPTPFFVNLLLFVFTSFSGKSASESKSVNKRAETMYLNRISLTLFAVSAITHTA